MRLSRFLRQGCILASACGAIAICACNRGVHPGGLGGVAPDFTVSDGEHTVRLADYRGKVVLLNLWGSNCGPCIQETPALIQLHHDHPEIVILAISFDPDPGPYHRFLERFHVDYATVRDPERKVAALYGTELYPESYIIDRRGILRRKVVSDPDWSSPEIRAYMQGL